jgi:hypothetical protein
MLSLAGMRALPLNATLLVLGVMLVWSLVRAARFGTRGAQATGELFRRILSQRITLAFLLLGCCINVSFSALSGYINPRDFVQDVVAAHQFLKHATMYPRDLPQMGVVELSAPIKGREELQKLPVIRNEFNTLTNPPAPANAHPPVLGITLAIPVLVLGLRGSFVFVLLLSAFFLYISVLAILRELFPTLAFCESWAVMGLIFGWYPVGTAFRSGQPSIILFALIAAGWLMLRRNKPWIAGGAIGLAACLHAFPALLTLYFLFRSRRAFFSAIGTITLLCVTAAALAVPHTFREWLDTADRNSEIFVPKIGNLSVAGLITSFSSGAGWSGHVKIVASAALVVIAGALVFFLWPWNLRKLRLERLDVEYSVFVAAMLLASPISWGRYLPIMLLPLAVLIRNWRQQPPAWGIPALLAALVFMSLSDSTIDWLHGWFTLHSGFAIGWLAAAMPSFSILAILLWLAFQARLTANADPPDAG